MEKPKTKKSWRYYLKRVMWVLIVQIMLANISASLYAYKFTHFYEKKDPVVSSQNIFEKTWKLFTGPKFYKITDESAPSFPYENVGFKTSDGIDIAAWYSGVDSARGCVIFFHGISVNKSFLQDEASVFRQWGYNVLLVDFRAHGKSGGNTSTFGMKETDEVQKAFEFAQSRGNSRIILYGVSLGAGVCLKAVSENRVKPAAVIADMPFGTLRNHLKARAKVLGFPSEPFATLVTLWIGIERGYNGFQHNVADYAGKVACPVLVEWGEQDHYVSRAEVEKVYASLASANKKFVVYANADHESFVNVDPNGWMNEMQSFLGSLK